MSRRLAACALIGVMALSGCGGDDGGDDGPSIDANPNARLTVNTSGGGHGTVTSSPAGIDCGPSCSATFTRGTELTLTATPDASSKFAGWNGVCTGTGPCTLTLAADMAINAVFDPMFALTVVKDGNGAGTVTSAPGGIDCGADCTESYDVGAVVTLTASADASSSFEGWSGGGCSGTAPCAVTLDQARTVTATFTLHRYALTAMISGSGTGRVTSAPAGIDCAGDCSEDYDHGTVVTLTATPSADSRFVGWTGGGCDGTGGCTVTITAVTTVTANFAVNRESLTVMRDGTGAGTVTSNPAGIDCGADCGELYTVGAMVTLTAMPSAGSVFSGWTGGGCAGVGPCTVTIDGPVTVTATFTITQRQLTVSRAGTGGGTVTSNPAGINCGADCSESYAYGTMVTLTATPVVGSTFFGWAGGGCDGTGNCVLSMTAPRSVTAIFVQNTYPLTVTRDGTGTGAVASVPAGIDCGLDCSEVYNHGVMVTLTATPAADSTFDGWTGGGCNGTGDCVITMTAMTSVAATFTVRRYPLNVTRMGPGAGKVTSNPAGIDCGADCGELYDHGTTVTLSPMSVAGSIFTGWNGAGCTGTGDCTVTMLAPVDVTATFTDCQGTTTLDYTGGLQTFTVPLCATSITIDAYGAEGGTSTGQNGGQNVVGGLGGRARGTFQVQGGENLTVLVGGRGTNSNCGSGGGGGTFVVRGGNLLVAAGGGGGGFHCNVLGAAIGAGGGAAGANGGGGSCTNAPGYFRPPAAGGMNGLGGTSAYGGGGGGFLGAGNGNPQGGGAYPGNGGNPGGGYGGGGSYYNGCCGGSGGGGGYSGGSGGQSDGCAGGGGGSVSNGANALLTPSTRPGHGTVIITW